MNKQTLNLGLNISPKPRKFRRLSSTKKKVLIQPIPKMYIRLMFLLANAGIIYSKNIPAERQVQTKYTACVECQANIVGIMIVSLFPLLCHNPPPPTGTYSPYKTSIRVMILWLVDAVLTIRLTQWPGIPLTTAQHQPSLLKAEILSNFPKG